MSALDREVLICYDVSESRARAKLYDALKNFGLVPVQGSVFWGHIRKAEERSILREFERLLDPQTDRAFIAPVALENCRQLLAFGHLDGAFTRPPETTVL